MAVEFEWMTQFQVISEALSGCPSEVPHAVGLPAWAELRYQIC